MAPYLNGIWLPDYKSGYLVWLSEGLINHVNNLLWSLSKQRTIIIPLCLLFSCLSVYMSVLLCVQWKREAFSLSLYLRPHQGSTPSPQFCHLLYMFSNCIQNGVTSQRFRLSLRSILLVLLFSIATVLYLEDNSEHVNWFLSIISISHSFWS